MALKLNYLAMIGLLCSLLVVQNTQAEPIPQGADAFVAGLTAYQNKDYQEAHNHFMNAWKANPEDAAALTNLGLSAYHLGQKPWAIAFFRRALTLEPGYFPASQGLKFVFSQLEVKEIPHQLETYEFLRRNFLSIASVYSYSWLLLFVTLLFGWSLLNYLGKRKRALEEEQPFPGFPWITISSGVLCCAFAILTGLKVYDLQIPRGTIVEDKVAAQSAPGEDQVNLFDLYGGFEVVIRNYSDDWVQVTYPGAMTGWIKKSSLFVTSGGSPW